MTLKDKLLAVMAEVNAQVAEREELTLAIAIALLTRKNLFILGEPGQAKSFVINLFRERIQGARQFERLLSKQTDEDQLFGRIDLSSLIPGNVAARDLADCAAYGRLREELAQLCAAYDADPADEKTRQQMNILSDRLNELRAALSQLYCGEPSVITTGKIPDSHIVFLDEIFKANDGVLNSLLTALNERKYTNEGHTYPIPVISFFSASNEIPNFSDPAERILAALYDRLELKVVTENVESRAARLQVLEHKQAGLCAQTQASITLDELYAMQQEVSRVELPPAINELMDDILCELRQKGVRISDRKYFNYYPIAQAQAWLQGRTKVSAADLLALRFYLWYEPAERTIIEPILERLCNNPLQAKINDIRAMAMETEDEFIANRSNGGNKALIKFRSEYLRLYQMYCELRAKAQSDGEREQLNELLADLEKRSQAAHEAVNFTYASLEELAALQ